ncbi:hypothetical protein S7711_07714 [Stachybotrys chartarum IBT 7711]|uniref:NADH:flavin oxidoreductase/NADH oxidase N-terminal domain-containing protein n=1 Tax=Stachybotrys chartarum (strain CBS 109288 / IBT 7711) TaxID=1280523 RepID=A0A084B7Y8_STACB|nr:hypothetical protein S7711_07714 [Stachybotrys chartarum IBT 7711]
MSSLLEPVVVGGKLPLRNRVGMGALTRNRCVNDFKPGPAQVKHYSERARDGAGLIVNEGTLVDWAGSDWKHIPVMINEDHAEAWKEVVAAVHEEGGTILFQAWHVGRIQNENMPIMKETKTPVLAPSAIHAEGGKYRELPGTPGHSKNITVIADPRNVVEMYRRAVQLAKNAGFDGVEFLAQGHFTFTKLGLLNVSIVATCLTNFFALYGGYEYICVKLCPADSFNDSVVTFEEMNQTYSYLIKELVKRRVGIINLSRRGVTSRPEGFPLPPGYNPVVDFGPLVKYPGSPSLLMVNHEYTPEEADKAIRAGKADLVSFGRPFIFNPDVISRIRHNIPFAENDRGDNVFYGPYSAVDEHYNDWPAAKN